MSDSAADRPRSSAVVILLPVYNDWDALALVLSTLEAALQQSGIQAEVVVVDDASTRAAPDQPWSGSGPSAITKVTVLTLKRNFGHQRAIALGLAYIEANLLPPEVVVMDADGEDDPADVPKLIQKCRELGGRRMIFARREKRSPNFTGPASE